MDDKVHIVGLTTRQVAMVHAVADLEAQSCAMFAHRLRSIPNLSFGMADEAAQYIEIRNAMEKAIPELRDGRDR